MAKFHGLIGYVHTEETAPGVFTSVVTERNYYGDVLRNNRKWENSNGVNDNLNINNMFSIVGDPYAFGNLEQMRYITWLGSKWKITNIEIQRPRVILTVGGVYNGN